MISLRLLRVLLTLTNPVLLFVGDPFIVIGFSLDGWLGNGDFASIHPRYDIMTTDGEGEGESVEKAPWKRKGPSSIADDLLM